MWDEPELYNWGFGGERLDRESTRAPIDDHAVESLARRGVRDVRRREELLPKRSFSASYVPRRPDPQAARAEPLGVTEAALRDYRRAERSWRGKKGGRA